MPLAGRGLKRGHRETQGVIRPETISIPSDELPGKGWFEVVLTPLERPGIAPVAYQVPWAGKKVLFSGRVPRS